MRALVYTSNTGYTAAYARVLGEKTGLPVIPLNDAVKQLPKGTPVIYLGWLFASNVKGYQKAAKRFEISAVCGVGLCETGTLLKEVRKAIALPEATPLFTLQGGMDHDKLHGINKFMINMLVKGLYGKANRTEDETRMLELIQKGGNYVSEQNTAAFMEWYHSR